MSTSGNNILSIFERAIVRVLIFLMVATIFFGTIELGVILLTKLVTPPLFLFNIESMLDIFGFFFMILIGIEVLETIKAYVKKDQVHVEIVFLVAMIAIARKVIILQFNKISPVGLIGIAAIIVSLASSYYIIKKTHAIKN
ncbi:MAG: phosphate-starvation-inducible PsiE family protein [Candidatus Aceula meridiana]|nr:phosphate-starvation-inducible PsiE family protein [Candidatus Aceula meridiana]